MAASQSFRSACTYEAKVGTEKLRPAGRKRLQATMLWRKGFGFLGCVEGFARAQVLTNAAKRYRSARSMLLLIRVPLNLITRLVRTVDAYVVFAKRRILRVWYSNEVQQCWTALQRAFERAAERLYYAAGAVVGAAQGLWREVADWWERSGSVMHYNLTGECD